MGVRLPLPCTVCLTHPGGDAQSDRHVSVFVTFMS